jgi:hypothetical protein
LARAYGGEGMRGQAVHQITLRLTLSADTLPADWDWVTLLDLAADEDVRVADWSVVGVSA